MSVCTTCEGCGQVANTEDQEPWTAWQNLPPGSDMAVRLGHVAPIPCPDCTPANIPPIPKAPSPGSILECTTEQADAIRQVKATAEAPSWPTPNATWDVEIGNQIPDQAAYPLIDPPPTIIPATDPSIQEPPLSGTELRRVRAWLDREGDR